MISETIALVFYISAPVSTRRLVSSCIGEGYICVGRHFRKMHLYFNWTRLMELYDISSLYLQSLFISKTPLPYRPSRIKNKTAHSLVVAYAYLANSGKRLAYCFRVQNRLHITAFRNSMAFQAVFNVMDKRVCHKRSMLLPYRSHAWIE